MNNKYVNSHSFLKVNELNVTKYKWISVVIDMYLGFNLDIK